MLRLWIVWLVFFLLTGNLFAREEKTETKKEDIELLQQKIDSLSYNLTQLINKQQQQEKEKELQALLDEANDLSRVKRKKQENLGKKFHTGVRQQSGLNPNISMGGDFFAAVSNQNCEELDTPNDFTYGNNGFFLREVELGLTAPLDPFTRGKTFISLTENELSLEEAYMEWLNLPLDMNLKIGLFNAEWGILNRYHDHALPQFDRPKVLTRFFTNGNLGGFGTAANFLLPPLLGANATLLDLTLINGGTGQSFTDQGDLNLLTAANLTHFYDITDDLFFEWRLGSITGYNDPQERCRSFVTNVAMNLKWIPTDRSKYRTIDWKTEFVWGHRQTPGQNINSKGIYSSFQNKVNASWWVGGRVDYTELPFSADQYEWALTANADFWQSEFVFIRFQYQYSQREIKSDTAVNDVLPDDHSFIVQVNWAMGPHKHEAY
ncbi:hypothetical protein GF407_17425 [candidate division KSB1 bacterium]|nr:hypothetical protein [candidate division KSB1 bacterium]